MNKKKPFFIAEISANHCGNFNHAKKLIRCAKINGADAVKLQTYTPDTMTIKSKKYFQIKKGLWKGYQLWDLYDKAQTPLVWHRNLFKYAKKLGIKIFSTPFDETAVDFLEKLNCPFYKVASFEMTDLPLIKKIAKTKKPMIISTGMANLKEISTTFKFAKKNGARDISLLYCVSNYPSKVEDFNLNNIQILKDKFKCKIGFSDHSNDSKVAMAAVAAGAEIVEKHIALDNQKKVWILNFHLKEKQIKEFREDINLAYNLLEKSFHRNVTENKSKIFRRSIFAVKDIKKGEKFSFTNIRRIRPGFGLEPAYFNKLINRKSPYNFNEGEPLKKSLIKS